MKKHYSKYNYSIFSGFPISCKFILLMPILRWLHYSYRKMLSQQSLAHQIPIPLNMGVIKIKGARQRKLILLTDIIYAMLTSPPSKFVFFYNFFIYAWHRISRLSEKSIRAHLVHQGGYKIWANAPSKIIAMSETFK